MVLEKTHQSVFYRSRTVRTFKSKQTRSKNVWKVFEKRSSAFRSGKKRSGVQITVRELFSSEQLRNWSGNINSQGVPGINILHISYLVLHLPQLPQKFLIEGQVQVRDSTCHQETPRLVQGTRVQWAPRKKTVGPKMEKHWDLTNTWSGMERMKHPPNFWFILVLFPHEHVPLSDWK